MGFEVLGFGSVCWNSKRQCEGEQYHAAMSKTIRPLMWCIKEMSPSSPWELCSINIYQLHRSYIPHLTSAVEAPTQPWAPQPNSHSQQQLPPLPQRAHTRPRLLPPQTPSPPPHPLPAAQQPQPT